MFAELIAIGLELLRKRIGQHQISGVEWIELHLLRASLRRQGLQGMVVWKGYVDTDIDQAGGIGVEVVMDFEAGIQDALLQMLLAARPMVCAQLDVGAWSLLGPCLAQQVLELRLPTPAEVLVFKTPLLAEFAQRAVGGVAVLNEVGAASA